MHNSRTKILTNLTVVALLGLPTFSMATDKVLRIGTTQEFENLNPLVANMMVSKYALAAVYRSELIILDENNQWVPQAAERIPTLENGDVTRFTENGVEKMRVRWQIRDEAVWGDGTPITGRDFEFAWQVGMSEKTSIPSKTPFVIVDDIAIDPQNPKIFTLTYNTVRWDYFKTMWNPLPAHVESEVFAEHGAAVEGYERHTKYTSAPATKGLYSGPYRISGIKLGSHIELVRNENWWGEAKPKLDRLLIRVIPNSGTLESNLVSGTIDMVMSVGFSLDQGLQLEKRITRQNYPFTVHYVDGLVFEHIDVNLDNPLLADPRTRQALLYAINREDLVQGLFDGKQMVAQHFIHPADPWYPADDPAIKQYRYSPRKARRLLREVGFRKGKDGILELDGKPFRITLMTTSGNKVRESCQVYIKEQLRQVGIAVEIKNQPAKVYFGDTVNKRKFEALALYAWVSAPETDPSQSYASTSIPSEENGWSGTNYPGWRNARVDAAIAKLNKAFDLSERRELMRTVLSEYSRELPSLPLYYRARVFVLPRNLTGVTPTATQYPETFHVERWQLSGSAGIAR